MNDFAKSQLMKYGWTEGKGLGKHENGITEALKPKLKLNTAGVGHKEKDWNNWWETAFNKAANSIKVDTKANDVAISVSNENTTSNLSNSVNEKQIQSPANYTNFLKTSMLLNGNLITENNSNVSKEEDFTHVSLTDEELFKVCGGRTAHKGARHGLTLNGKLNRIAQQEKYLLSRNVYKSTSGKLENNNNTFQDEYEIDNNNEIMLPTHPFTEELIVPRISRTVKRRNRKCITDLTHQLRSFCNVNDDNTEGTVHSISNASSKKESKVEEKEKSKKCKRKKERKGSVSDNVESIKVAYTDNISDDTSPPVNKKLRKKMKKKIQEQTTERFRNNINDEFKHRKKKKKSKKKNQDYQYEYIIDSQEDEELDGFKTKKMKSQKFDSTLQSFSKNEDANASEYKFQTKLFHDETSMQSNQTSDSGMGVGEPTSNMMDEYFKDKVNELNAKILKKKKYKLRKQRKRQLCKITESLKAVHIDNTEPTGEKNTKKKVEAVVEHIMSSDVAIDQTRFLKKENFWVTNECYNTSSDSCIVGVKRKGKRKK